MTPLPGCGPGGRGEEEAKKDAKFSDEVSPRPRVPGPGGGASWRRGVRARGAGGEAWGSGAGREPRPPGAQPPAERPARFYGIF